MIERKRRVVTICLIISVCASLSSSMTAWADEGGLEKRVEKLEQENIQLKVQIAKLESSIEGLQKHGAEEGNSIHHAKDVNNPDPGPGGTEDWNKDQCPEGTFVTNARLLGVGTVRLRVALQCRRAWIERVHN